MSDHPPTLHNHILQAIEDQSQLQKHVPDRKRFGVLATGLLLAHKKRKLTEISLAVEDKNQESVPEKEEQAEKDDTIPVDRDVEYYQRMKDECLKQEAEQAQWANDLKTKVHDLRDVYIFGLSKV